MMRMVMMKEMIILMLMQINIKNEKPKKTKKTNKKINIYFLYIMSGGVIGDALDLIYVEGETPCISNSIKFAEKIAGHDTKWTHMGLIVTKQIFNFLLPNKIYVLESAIHTSTVSGNKNGVQISTLANFLTRTKSYTIKKLANNPYTPQHIQHTTDEKKTHKLEQFNMIINEFYKEFKDTYYEFTLIEMFASIFPCCGLIYNGCCCGFCCCGCNQNTFMFCSELIVKLLQRLEYIPFSVSQLQSPYQLDQLLASSYV